MKIPSRPEQLGFGKVMKVSQAGMKMYDEVGDFTDILRGALASKDDPISAKPNTVPTRLP